MMYLLLLVGFIVLIKGADMFVDGSSNIAKAMKIPSVIIGLTIVAMGTSAPEASVSITAALAGNNEIALSNITGSNIFNLMIVVGICAVIKPATTHSDILKRDFPVTLAVSVLVLFFLRDNAVSRNEGLILMLLMGLYLAVVIGSAIRSRNANDNEIVENISIPKSAIFMAVGLGAVIFGGNLVVNSSVDIAEALGLSQTLIGLTIVAMGTSLPELATSLVAAKKGDSGLSLGNAVGSNIFNALFILGTSATLSPISVGSESFIDALVLVVVTAVMFIFCFTHKKADRKEGIICIAMYTAYMVYVVMR